ncbi:MAG: serine hydrolase [Bryobacteraceae bacterium]|nr:serine hydrolase [Bryobacteraceae bacterium]
MRVGLTLALCGSLLAADYFPPPDSAGGWRTLSDPAEIRRVSGIDIGKLDEAFAYIQGSSKHGGLLVARHGWLVYEKYFGRGARDATPNSASVGKSFTSIAAGILIHERPDLFPEGLEQRIFTRRHFPPEAFPLSDPAKAEIKLGQLLAMTAGIRGNNPGLVYGREVTLDPPGPDGWLAMVDEMALGKVEGEKNTIRLWTKPGRGYSYATASVHLASIMLRHVAGMELERYIEERLARPMGWGRWGFGYKRPEIAHTPGGGGIALRATDMLRSAYLLLREGRWGARRLVPAEYVRHCASRWPYNPHSAYSLQFNVNSDGDIEQAPRDAFWKTGSGGHAIYVVPSLDLVAFKLAGRDDQYEPDPAIRYDGSREGWSPTVDADAAALRTLELIVSAVAR